MTPDVFSGLGSPVRSVSARLRWSGASGKEQQLPLFVGRKTEWNENEKWFQCYESGVTGSGRSLSANTDFRTILGDWLTDSEDSDTHLGRGQFESEKKIWLHRRWSFTLCPGLVMKKQFWTVLALLTWSVPIKREWIKFLITSFHYLNELNCTT